MITKLGLYLPEIIICSCDEFSAGEFSASCFSTSCFRRVVFDELFSTSCFRRVFLDSMVTIDWFIQIVFHCLYSSVLSCVRFHFYLGTIFGFEKMYCFKNELTRNDPSQGSKVKSPSKWLVPVLEKFHNSRIVPK